MAEQRDFVFVETAINGSIHRNHVERLDAFRAPAGAEGVYTTYFRYTDDLVAWVGSHVNESGNPTVKQYRGPCWTPILPFDVDRADPAVALADTRRLVGWLTDHWDVPPEAVAITFSGSKGYHVEVPATLFGGFEPGPDLPARLGALARRLLDGSGITVDWDVYQPLRLWRVPNTIHE